MRMSPTAKTKIVSLFLIASLVTTTSLAQNQSKSESARRLRCIELLEQISSAHGEKPSPLQVVGRAPIVRLVDLSQITEAEVSNTEMNASRSDVLVLNDSILQNATLLKAIKSSPALFSIKAAQTTSKQVADTLELSILQPRIVVALPADIRGVHNTFGTSETIAGPQVLCTPLM